MDTDFDSGSGELRGPETSYLIECVGSVLRQYIAEVLIKRPVDPIDYLGRCLKNYIKIRDIEIKESIENNEIIHLNQLEENETSLEIENEDKPSDITTESKNNEHDSDDKMINNDIHMNNINKVEANNNNTTNNDADDREVQDRNQLQSDSENYVKESINEGEIDDDDDDGEQSTLKFDNETDDDITFESQIKQDINETPLEDIIDHDHDGDDDDDDPTEGVTDSEVQ
ncbi:unnamed protein product [Schistosoma spindalis]|nr:unnamed protein product [Schistosoma spindale]